MTRRELWVSSALFTVVSLVSFAPVLRPSVMLFGTDTFAGGYAFYEAIAQQLRQGELPRWMPHVFGGLPLFANAGSTFQPVHLLASLVLPTSAALIFVLVVHFALAGIGMHALARELGARSQVAIVAGLAFELTGLSRSWVYAGHDGRIIALTLAPLVLTFIARTARTNAPRDVAGLAISLGSILLGFQIQVAWYLLVLGAAWAVFCVLCQASARLPRVRSLAVGLVLAFGLGAINFLPFASYVAASARGGSGPSYDFGTSFSATPRDFAGFGLPDVPGVSVTVPGNGSRPFSEYRGPNRFKLHTEYVGAAVLLGLVLALLAWRDATIRFFLGSAVFFGLLALGGNTPLYSVLWRVLPGLHRFRAPDLAMSMLVVCVSVLAALGLEAWLRSSQRRALAIAAVFTFTIAAGLALWAQETQALLRFAAPLVIAAVAIAFIPSRPRVAFFALGLITAVDLGLVARHFMYAVPPIDEVMPRDGVVAFLEKRAQPERTWVLPVSKPWRRGGNLLMRFGVRQLGGEHPLPTKRWLEWVGLEGTAVSWSHVFRNPELTPEGMSFESTPVFLAAANVRHLVSAEPLAVPWLREVYRGADGVVSELDAALPQAWLVGEAKVVGTSAESLSAVQDPRWDPRHTAIIEAEGPLWLDDAAPVIGAAVLQRIGGSVLSIQTLSDRRALLVVSEAWHEGWRAWIDEEPVPVFATNHAFRGIPVPAGQHRVTLRFEPPALWSGVLLSFTSLAAVLFLLSRRGQPE